jgi:hypothetical protein
MFTTPLPKLIRIAEIISNPSKSFYSSFPEFTPLEFEHFCAFLLQKDGHQILQFNQEIEADGGIDIITQKDNKIYVVQVKKSDWGGKEKDYISLSTVDRHLGVIARNESRMKLEYGQQNEVLAYFITLKRFSTPARNQFLNEPRMILVDIKELKKMIHNFGVLAKEVSVVVWQDQELEKIKKEIEVLENLVAEREIYKENLKSKIQQIEKIILLALLDLNRILDLKKAELEFLRQKLMSQKQEEFSQKQQKIEDDYDNLEQEFVSSKIKILDPEQEDELKTIYRKLQHLYHPDKHQDNREHYEKISKIINQAKNDKDIDKLRDILNNPEKYFNQNIDNKETDKDLLAKFISNLKQKLAETGDVVDSLENTNSYKLYQLFTQDEQAFAAYIEKEKDRLEKELEQIDAEIISLA